MPLSAGARGILPPHSGKDELAAFIERDVNLVPPH
jgi:hypothetical protein